jgi:hypothetical protein
VVVVVEDGLMTLDVREIDPVFTREKTEAVRDEGRRKDKADIVSVPVVTTNRLALKTVNEILVLLFEAPL